MTRDYLLVIWNGGHRPVERRFATEAAARRAAARAAGEWRLFHYPIGQNGGHCIGGTGR